MLEARIELRRKEINLIDVARIKNKDRLMAIRLVDEETGSWKILRSLGKRLLALLKGISRGSNDWIKGITSETETTSASAARRDKKRLGFIFG